MSPPSGVKRGIATAALAAVLFGATTPLVKLASAGASALVAGALLYLGAALGALAMAAGRRRRFFDRALLGRRTLGRLALVAVVGGACGPALLVMGLARTDAATASLLLTLEAPYTVVLAGLLLGEHIGRRVALAAALIAAGAALLVAPGAV